MIELLQDLFSVKVAYASDRVDQFIHNANALIVNPLIGLLFALALLFFLYGVFEFISNADNEEKRSTGKMHIMWGVVGIAVMLSVWAILGLVIRTLNIENVDPKNGTVNLPDYKPTYPKVGN